MKLYRALLDCDAVLLTAIAERWGAELTTTRKRDMADQLATALLDPEPVQEFVSWLPPRQRRLPLPALRGSCAG